MRRLQRHLLRLQTKRYIFRAKPTPIVYDKEKREFYKTNKNLFLFFDKLHKTDNKQSEILEISKELKEIPKDKLKEFISIMEENGKEENKRDIGILRIHWLTSFKCNLQCKHCYNSSSSQRKIPLVTPIDILNFADRYGTVEITLSGGEPFVYPKIKETIDLFTDNNLAILIFTNGTKIPDWFYETYSNGKIGIYISLDGPQEHHDYLRGKGNYKKTFNAFKKLYEINSTNVVINTIATSKNIRLLKQWISKLLERFRNLKIQIGRFLPSGRGKINRELIVNPVEFHEELQKIEEELGKEIILTSDEYINFSAGRWGKCSGGRTKISIDPKGNIFPCPLIMHPTLQMGTVWEFKKENIENFNIILNNDECQTCKIKEHCYSCVGVAYTYCTAIGNGSLEIKLNKLKTINLN